MNARMPLSRRYTGLTTTEYISPVEQLDEFSQVIDSLGRVWDALKHPRDHLGRFIRTFSTVKFNTPDHEGPNSSVSGVVQGVDQDGTLLAKVDGVEPGADPRVKVGDLVRIQQDKVEVQTIKAKILGRRQDKVGTLNKQQLTSVNNGIQALKSMNLPEHARMLTQARDLAVQQFDAKRDPEGAQAVKDQAIDLFRKVGEALGDERGKGFDDGVALADVVDSLDDTEKARLNTLNDVIGTTNTAKHALGDKTIDAGNDQGPIKAGQSKVRLQAASEQLRKDFAEGTEVWDLTGDTIVPGTMAQPVKATVVDAVAKQEGQNILPDLQPSTYQRLKTGLTRLSGWGQAQQVAPGDRFHTDMDGNEVIVGSWVHVNPTKSRPGYLGQVYRIHTDLKGKKHVLVRDFDPGLTKGYTKVQKQEDGTKIKVPATYQDNSVQGKSIRLADPGEQVQIFEDLALLGSTKSAKSLIDSFTSEYVATMQRRYASGDAKRTSPTAGTLYDNIPVHLRVKRDANGEDIKIGDFVQDPNGAIGMVTYLEPNANTARIQYPNGQEAPRITSRKLTRLHGPTSDVYPGESEYGDSNYMPTRDEAADIAEAKGASSVAQVIRDGGDHQEIKDAMVADPAFQTALQDTPDLYSRRDQALAAGQEPTDEDKAALHDWAVMAAASAEQFREPDDTTPPTPPSAPQPDDDTLPQNPANPTEKVSPGGTPVRDDGTGNVIVDDNTEDPVPADDTAAVQAKVDDADGAGGDEAEEEGQAPQPPPLAQKVADQVHQLVSEVESDPDRGVTSVQKAQMDKHTKAMDDALATGDGDAYVQSLRELTKVVNSPVNRQLQKSTLQELLNGKFTNGMTMADFVQGRLDAGNDIFAAPQPVARPNRPASAPDDVPEGVDPKVDGLDDAVSEGLLNDDGSVKVMVGEEEVDEGFYVVDPDTITEFDAMPTEEEVASFLAQTDASNYKGLSTWFDEADGRYRMARVQVFDTKDDAAEAAENSGTNQFVDISDGQMHNLALGDTSNATPESIEDPRSEARAVRKSGTGKAAARTTAKQKTMLDHVAEVEGADPEIGRITEAVKNGEEINGADASRLADFVDGLDASQFEKPSDKGVASQMAHKLARASGEEGARGYSSQNTALRRSSDVGISLSAQSQDEAVTDLVDAARIDVKNGDNAAASAKYREAADAYDALSLPNDAPSTRAREHADRLDAMGGTTETPAEGEGGGPAAPSVGGWTAGDKVETDWGPGEISNVTGRSVSIKLDSGEEINLVQGTPGLDRVKKVEPEAEPEAPAAPAELSPEDLRDNVRALRAEGAPEFGENYQREDSDEQVLVGDTEVELLSRLTPTDEGSTTLTDAGLSPTPVAEAQPTLNTLNGFVSAAENAEIRPAGSAARRDQFANAPGDGRYLISDDGTSGVIVSNLPNGQSGEIMDIFANDPASLHTMLANAVGQGANRALLSFDDADLFDDFAAHGFKPTVTVPDAGEPSKFNTWFVRDPAFTDATVDVGDAPEAKDSQVGINAADVGARWAQLNGRMGEVRDVVARDPESMQKYMDRYDSLLGTLEQYGVTNYGNNQLEEIVKDALANAPVSDHQRGEMEAFRDISDRIGDDDNYGKRLGAALDAYDAAIAAKDWGGARRAIAQAKYVQNHPDGVGGTKPDRSVDVANANIKSKIATDAAAIKTADPNGAVRGDHPDISAWMDHLDYYDKPVGNLSTDEINALVDQGWKQLYRTVNTHSYANAPQMLDNIRSADKHRIGNGIYGQGLYFSDDLNGSLAYSHNISAARDANDDSSAYMRAVIAPDARWVQADELYAYLRDPNYRGLGLEVIAALHGYDVIVTNDPDSSYETYYNIINRGVLATEDINTGAHHIPSVAPPQGIPGAP